MTVEVGDAAPDFALRDQDGTTRRLAEFRGGWVVLYFYPKDETPNCTRQACAFRDSHQAFEAENVTVLGVSADGVADHKEFAVHHHLPFALLADPQKLVIRAYGASGLLGIPKRITFLIDPEGIVRAVHEAHFRPGSHVKAMLEAKREIEAAPMASK